MTERPRWQARIEIAGETLGARETLGAGILVDPTRVLTCAHVVDGRTDVRVAFPNAPRCQDLPAAVAFRGPWRRLNDTGDIAVLELRQPVGIAPATFADPGMRHAHGRRELSVYGFREGNEIWGSYARVTADHREVMGDWVQVNTVHGHPEPLQEGFSGAAAYDPDTGIVHGMITEADPDRPMGRMLPVSSIRRHWEELDDLLMLDWLGVTERRALREIVRGAAVDVPMAHVLAAVPGPADPPACTSVWDAIRFVGEECHGDLRLTRFLGALERHLPADVAGRLRAWRRHTLPGPGGGAAGTVRRPAMTSVIVTVDRIRAADEYRLTFSTLVAGVPTARGGPVEVRGAGQVRRAVEAAIHDLIGTVAGRRPVIEFVL
ncbi:MAG: trypsin-like peptidase domain-containing protein, partial [Actinomadura sp.]